MTAQTPTLGFWKGAASIWDAMRFVAGSPRTWGLVVLPPVIFLVLALVGTGVAGATLGSDVRAFLQGGALLAPLGALGSGINWVIAGALSLAVGILAALVITPVLSAPAIERLVSLQEAALGLTQVHPASLLQQFACGLRAQLLPLLVGVPLIAALSLLTLLLPVLAPLTTLLKLSVAGMGIAWNCFDYPLTLRGMAPRARLKLLAKAPAMTLGFACGCSLLLLVPCVPLIVLPVGAVAATRLLALLGKLEGNPVA
jgi:Etoposide-induced protein 2.4 (EI24)